jgi:hypothetical protein
MGIAKTAKIAKIAKIGCGIGRIRDWRKSRGLLELRIAGSLPYSSAISNRTISNRAISNRAISDPAILAILAIAAHVT